MRSPLSSSSVSLLGFSLLFAIAPLSDAAYECVNWTSINDVILFDHTTCSAGCGIASETQTLKEDTFRWVGDAYFSYAEGEDLTITSGGCCDSEMFDTMDMTEKDSCLGWDKKSRPGEYCCCKEDWCQHERNEEEEKESKKKIAKKAKETKDNGIKKGDEDDKKKKSTKSSSGLSVFASAFFALLATIA